MELPVSCRQGHELSPPCLLSQAALSEPDVTWAKSQLGDQEALVVQQEHLRMAHLSTDWSSFK